jgi:hypothetical protein
VCEEEYAQLPTFIRGQLPLDVLNASLAAVHAAAAERSSGEWAPAAAKACPPAQHALPLDQLWIYGHRVMHVTQQLPMGLRLA